ncbi:MAG: recombinase family protein [Oscillospiraceae bacterium]|nr:recombinase family protein [Oscillospiraceae bacterium]
MARTKNRGLQQSFSPSYTVRRWRLGAYIRLSKEDLKKAREGKDDSNSVKNQRDLLGDFYFKHQDEFESITEYVDDGHTGTDANREDFQRLLADVMSGKINCVIVKDLSRFARNYSDAGSLIDNLFVQMGVRFISLAENVDSYRDPDSVSSIIVPITNVMNDQYCYQTSKKIRQIFDYKRRNGQYIGSFAPYGYLKDPRDKHQLIVDPDAAEIVKLIYDLCLQGMARRTMVYYLNDHGIPSPTTYRREKGLPASSTSNNPLWGDKIVTLILTNPIYTGDLVQGRRRVKSYKVHQIEQVPEDEWVRVSDTHEAIIDRETFEKVQALLKRDTRTAPRKKELHLFSGFLRCADCGKSVTRSQSGQSYRYLCSTYKNRSRTACTMHAIKHERLEAAVLFAVRQQVHLAVSYSEIIARINSAPVKKNQSFRLDDLISTKERELAKITRYKQSLYQDWKDGEITQQDYRDMKADYERQIASLSDILARLTSERAELTNGVDNEHPALVAFMKYQNIETLNREILIELVDHIKVYENGNISVKFKFSDELRQIDEYIEINTTEAPAVAG